VDMDDNQPTWEDILFSHSARGLGWAARASADNFITYCRQSEFGRLSGHAGVQNPEFRSVLGGSASSADFPRYGDCPPPVMLAHRTLIRTNALGATRIPR